MVFWLLLLHNASQRVQIISEFAFTFLYTGCHFSDTLILASINPKYDVGFVQLLFKKSKHPPTQLENVKHKTIKCRIFEQLKCHFGF